MKKQMITPIVRVIRYDSESLMIPASLGSGKLGSMVDPESDCDDNAFAPTRQGIFGDSDF